MGAETITFKRNTMKVEFELNLDSNGRPCIKFRHYDRDNSLEQKALKVFLDSVKEKGFTLRNPSGYLECGTSKSWENYEIQIAK
tara:strand:+ start:534 stop:785 length:252 start_codon:yes stop_codon:yes gene_type:complete